MSQKLYNFRDKSDHEFQHSKKLAAKLGNGILEGIKDNQGNLRFIEGVNTNTELTGLTINYSRWSLSGTHLMVVVAGQVTAGTTITDGFEYGVCANMPQWIKDKIYPTASFGIVEFKDLQFHSTTAWSSISTTVRIRKYGNNIFIDQNNPVTNNTDQTLGFRIQFDLLIDTD